MENATMWTPVSVYALARLVVMTLALVTRALAVSITIQATGGAIPVASAREAITYQLQAINVKNAARSAFSVKNRQLAAPFALKISEENI